MCSKLLPGRKGIIGITIAGCLMATIVAGQAAALWGNVTTFMTEAELNGAPVQFTYNGNTKNVLAGVFRASMSDGQSFVAFCTDALNTVSSGYFLPHDNMPVENGYTNPIWVNGGGARAAAVYNAHISSVYGMPGSARGPGTTEGDVAAAALQVAIWKALYDDTICLDQGLFRVSSNGSAVQDEIIGQATAFLRSALNPEDPWPDDQAMWWMPVNEDGSLRTAQGLIGPNSNNAQSVPAPESFALASLLAGGLGFLARRRMAV